MKYRENTDCNWSNFDLTTTHEEKQRVDVSSLRVVEGTQSNPRRQK